MWLFVMKKISFVQVKSREKFHFYDLSSSTPRTVPMHMRSIVRVSQVQFMTSKPLPSIGTNQLIYLLCKKGIFHLHLGKKMDTKQLMSKEYKYYHLNQGLRCKKQGPTTNWVIFKILHFWRRVILKAAPQLCSLSLSLARVGCCRRHCTTFLSSSYAQRDILVLVHSFPFSLVKISRKQELVYTVCLQLGRLTRVFSFVLQYTLRTRTITF